jgi:hypothetical protein
MFMKGKGIIMESEFFAKLTFNSGMAPRYWSVHLYKRGQRASIAHIGNYTEPHMAVDAAGIWQEPVTMQPHEYEACCMAWSLEGMQVYAEGLPREVCANPAIEHGWRLAWGGDVQKSGATA